jgi:fucose permease
MGRYGEKKNPNGWAARISDALKSGGWGVGIALVVILCCAPVIIALTIYLAGTTILIGLTQYKLYLTLTGLAVTLAAGWTLLRSIGSCSANERRLRLSQLALVLSIFGGYLLISYLLLPWLYTNG